MIYSWSTGSRISIDAEKAYKEMSSLPDATPEAVLNLARDETTELHGAFEWDDSIAAEEYRKGQARHLIQCIVVRSDDAPKQDAVRAFQISSQKNVYKPISFFLDNKDEYLRLLDRAKTELYTFKSRYKQLSELENVFDAINKL